MARADTFIAASPERVWEVLADAPSYADWVVGSDAVRDADEDWPAVGSRFHHRIRIGPMTIEDHTEVLDAYPPLRLELRARARPLGTARVSILLAPRDGGTHVTMIEDPADPLSALAFTPLSQLGVRKRNVETLRRLRTLAERAGA